MKRKKFFWGGMTIATPQTIIQTMTLTAAMKTTVTKMIITPAVMKMKKMKTKKKKRTKTKMKMKARMMMRTRSN